MRRKEFASPLGRRRVDTADSLMLQIENISVQNSGLDVKINAGSVQKALTLNSLPSHRVAK